MKRTGKIKQVYKDWDTGKLIIMFELDSVPDDLAELSICEKLEISAQKYRKRRSLNANSYFHVLAGSIASKLGTTLDHEKNRLIREYGQYEFIDGFIPTILIASVYEDRLLDMEGVHWKPVARPDKEHVKLAFMRGSHTYNTEEMSRLIDGTVSEAKELGLETLTPQDLERMKSAWTA